MKSRAKLDLDFQTAGCPTISVKSNTSLFSDICWRSRLSFHVVIEHCAGFDFLKKFFSFFARIFFYGCVRQKLIFAGFGPGSQVARVDGLRDRLLGPLWANLAEILRGKRARVWLRMMQILLGHVEVRGRSSWKTGKKTVKNRRFSMFFGLGCPTVFTCFSTAAPAYLNMPQKNFYHP